MATKYTFTEEEYEEVKSAEKATRDKYKSQKLKVIILRCEGKKNSEIAERLGISLSRVTHLIGEYKKQGIEEYISNKYHGNHRNMSAEREQEILDGFRARAESGQIITIQEIKAEFDKEVGRDTGSGYIYMLLNRHGWRKIKPRPEHPQKASEEEIAASKKLKPSWKKSS